MNEPINIDSFNVRDDYDAIILILRPKGIADPIKYRIPKQLVGNLIHQMGMPL